MKFYSKFVFLGFLAAQLVLPGTSVSAQQVSDSHSEEARASQPETHPVVSQQTAQEDDTRAKEWRERRRQKSQQVVPSKRSGLEKALLYVEEKGIRELLTIRFKDFYPKFGNLSHGSGLAPGIRYFKSKLGGSGLSLETSAAFSFTGYKLGNLQFGRFNKTAPYVFLGPADFGAPFKFGEERPGQVKSFLYADVRYRYFPREDFYGLGRESREEDRSDFLLEDGFYDVVAGYQFNRWIGASVRFGYLQMNTDPGSDDRFPDIQTLFGDDAAPGLTRQPDFLHLDSAIYLDYRDTPGNPHKGGVIGISFSRFDDRGGKEFEFNRFSLDARHYLPLGSKQRILALRFFASLDEADPGGRVPFYFQNTLGGNETLRGFRQFRFRDSRSLYLSAEYRWEASPAVELVIFYDAGKVFPESEDLDFEHLEKSIGAGIRIKTSNQVFLRLDVGRSDEGTRIHFRFGPSF